MKYAYQRQGGPILSWNRAAPQQTRAADAKALGSLGGDTLGAMLLPMPGAPEPISGLGGCGSCGGMRGTDDAIGEVIRDNKFIIGLGIAAYIGHKFFKKKRR